MGTVFLTSKTASKPIYAKREWRKSNRKLHKVCLRLRDKNLYPESLLRMKDQSHWVPGGGNKVRKRYSDLYEESYRT
jgi:hypothetical protein